MLTPSKVRICNMALSNIGSQYTIENLTENSVPAKQCNLWYDFSHTQGLEAYDWSFARKRAVLALHGDDAPGDIWSYRYALPADCVRPRSIINPVGVSGDAVPFEQQISTDLTKCILTNLEEAELLYTFFQENTAMFTPHYAMTLSYYVASNIALALTGKRTIRDNMIAMAVRLASAAPAHDANSEVAEPPRDAEWISGR